jgi:dihydroneopterin triphosphate diphosphatase
MDSPDITRYKIPVSVLVVIHTPDLQVLLAERAGWPGFWQSVTGSLEHADEDLSEAALREVREETGIDAGRYMLRDWHIRNRFEIYKRGISRYAPGTTHNTEHVFGLAVAEPQQVRVAPDEHLRYQWLPWREAAAICLSWSNREAILLLPRKAGASA